MIRLRVAAALAGLGALALSPQVSALVVPEPGTDAGPVARASAGALALLESAARATRVRAWSGTQHVVSMAAGVPQVSDTRVDHVPGRGSALGAHDDVVAADVLDESLLTVLAETYDLAVVARRSCEGRPAQVVEARRPGLTGRGAVAGRFWVDDATGLVLRREVLGTDGRVLRRSELTDVRVGPPVADVATAETAGSALRPRGERLSAQALEVLGRQGWPVPRTLPSGMTLFDARLLDDQVLQLSYSDGLTTLSLFGQRGELPASTTGVVRTVQGGKVWLTPGVPGRVVWSEHGRTWTLVSDAPPDVVDEIVAALPHGGGQLAQDGLGPRVWRGMARVGAWLNPFD